MRNSAFNKWTDFYLNSDFKSSNQLYPSENLIRMFKGNYIKNLNYFSSKFIQSNGASLEEGSIYIKDSKIRLDYFHPDRTLIISKKKCVYINHELKEENFFSTEKNTVRLFYDIFLDYSFFSSIIAQQYE